MTRNQIFVGILSSEAATKFTAKTEIREEKLMLSAPFL